MQIITCPHCKGRFESKDSLEVRNPLIAAAMKRVLRDPNATNAQIIDASKILAQHTMPARNRKGMAKNLKNQKPKREINKDLLG